MTLLTTLLALGVIGCDGAEKPDDTATTDTKDAGTTDDTSTDQGATDDTATETGGTTDTSPVGPCDTDDMSINLGTGESGYEPVEEGGTIDLFFGEQGGWHFFGGFEIYQSNQIVTFEVAGYDVETGAKVCQHGDSPLQVALVPSPTDEAECRQIYYQVYCYILCPMDEALVDGACDNPNEVLPDRDIRFEVNVTDLDGKIGSDTLNFKAGAETSNPTECIDDGVCSGTSSDTGLEG